MKKGLFITLFMIATLCSNLFAGDKPLRIGAGAGVSMGFFDYGDEDSDYADVAAIWATILSLRAGVYGDCTYFFAPGLGVGGEVGVYYLNMKVDTGSSTRNYYTVDFPVRGYVRLGSGATYLQGFGGYYFSSGNFIDLDGPEAGAKVCLGRFNIVGSYIFAENPYARIELGFSLPNLLKF